MEDGRWKMGESAPFQRRRYVKATIFSLRSSIFLGKLPLADRAMPSLQKRFPPQAATAFRAAVIGCPIKLAAFANCGPALEFFIRNFLRATRDNLNGRRSGIAQHRRF
jgi:hypothetical protein